MYKESLFNLYIEKENKTYIYNTLSGAMVAFKDKVDFQNVSCENEETLLKQGFIVDESLDELNMLKCQRNWTIWNSHPKGIVFTVATTMACQANCPYCFEKKTGSKSKMTTDVAENVAGFIEKRVLQTSTQKVQVTFFGGEPTLAINPMLVIGERLKKFCEDRSVQYVSTIITNGILFSGAVAQDLHERINMNRVQITLDGTRDTHNTIKGIDCFDTILSNINDVSEFMDVNIRLNISQDNREDMLELCSLLDRIIIRKDKVKIYTAMVRGDYEGCDDVDGMQYLEYDEFMNKLYNDFENSELFERKRLLPKVGRAFCSFESSCNCCIDPEGYLYKCEHDIGVKNKNIGNILVGNNWSEYEMKFYRDYDERCIQKKCPYLPICFGGCMMERNNGITENCNNIQSHLLHRLSTYLDM